MNKFNKHFISLGTQQFIYGKSKQNLLENQDFSSANLEMVLIVTKAMN